MNIAATDLVNCIRKAREITTVYDSKLLGNGYTSRSLDLLKEVCIDSCGHDIDVLKNPQNNADTAEEDSWLYGVCILEPTKAIILYAHHLNLCWQRFTICKELFHIVLDKDEYRSMDIYQHIENITLSFPIDDSMPSKPVACEFLAELAAMEFLLPYSSRDNLRTSATFDAKQVAEKFKIPLLLVEKYLSVDYMKNLKDI
jgi:Zn-dependent peptidase ImmA (M78 family)